MNKDEILYIVILNYNNTDDTIECLNSVSNIKNVNTKIVLIDNGSDQECVKQLEKSLNDKVVFIKNSKNIGYAAGNNVGIKYAIAQGANYIAILNNDVIVNEHSFDDCINILTNNSTVGIVGPAILNYKSDILQSAGAKIDFLRLSTKLNGRNTKYIRQDKQIECDYIGGACLVFTPHLIDYIGYLPEMYFLFWEETEWCVSAKRHGLKVICTLNSSVEHKGSSTINKIKGISGYYMERNKVIFSRRNNNMFLFSVSFVVLIIRAFYKSVRNEVAFHELMNIYIDGLCLRDRVSY